MGLINGAEYQHANINLQAGAVGPPLSISTFKKLSYKVTGAKKPVLNAQGIIIGYTIDNMGIEASLSMLLSEWFSMCDWLRIQAPALAALMGMPGQALGIGQIPIDFTVTFGNSLTNYKTEQLLGVMINEDPRDSQDNQEALIVELPLFVMQVIYNDGSSFIMPQGELGF